MASCGGKRKNGSTCASSLLKCQKCGAIGCDQIVSTSKNGGECSRQGFYQARCLKCGALGSYI